ncbi:10571_t:CDS:2 [Funneliformis geosporum]|uniref:5067_t:CDS:1 n=1 Tax=Funneliformis geosporum TaxID=1117311 RepID=A0A9W4WKD9_9GLOM|nr:10571_t:CDS:2 [Funneliformis geosporum]CAI2168151.1 5067_t:CDS:2 [Funneliformis geosporum]
MVEKIDRSFRDTFQNSVERYSVRPEGNKGKTTTLSSAFGDNCMGRDKSIMDVLYPSACQKNVITRSEEISCQNVGSFERKNFDDGDEYIRSPCNFKSNLINKKATKEKSTEETEKEYRQIYVLSVDPMRERTNYDKGNDKQKQPSSGEFKGGSDTDVTMVPFEYCSNQDTVIRMQASLGQLLRNDSLADVT